MKLKKFKINRVDSGAMVYGLGRPIGVHYSAPDGAETPIVPAGVASANYFFTVSEYFDILRWLMDDERRLPDCLYNIAIQFESYSEKGYLKHLAPNYWEVESDYPEFQKTFFWSCDLGNSRQANQEEVRKMMRTLFPVTIVHDPGEWGVSIITIKNFDFHTAYVRTYGSGDKRLVALEGLPPHYLAEVNPSTMHRLTNAIWDCYQYVEKYVGGRIVKKEVKNQLIEASTPEELDSMVAKFLRENPGDAKIDWRPENKCFIRIL